MTRQDFPCERELYMCMFVSEISESACTRGNAKTKESKSK